MEGWQTKWEEYVHHFNGISYAGDWMYRKVMKYPSQDLYDGELKDGNIVAAIMLTVILIKFDRDNGVDIFNWRDRGLYKERWLL